MKNIKNEYNESETLEDYFIVIGVDPRVSLNNYLYNTNIEELNTFFIKDEISPKILSKFPPIKKSHIDIHSSIIDLCFQKEYKLEEFESKPEPETFHFILDNSFFSMDYLLKYVSCLKIYESLEQYFSLKNEIKKLLEDEYHNSWKIFGTGKKGKKYKSENDLKNVIEYGRNKSEFEIKEDNSKNLKNFKKYYFPKILCLVSTQPIFIEQEKILKQIYHYYLDKTPKKIPLEKIILNILLNIPIPPRGIFEINYNLNKNYEKIIIKKEKMNELSNLDKQLKLIFSKFSINKVLIIFFNVLFESKIVFFSENISEISYFIHGIISLLFPFQYSFQISSSIPKEALDVLESISPFILGINTKFSQYFFTKNKIDSIGLNLLIIDLDRKSVKRIGKDNLPNIPKFLYQPLIDELNKNLNIEKNIINSSKIRKAFFDLFIKMMDDYEIYLNKDYFMKKLTISGIKSIFKIDDFIEAHYSDKDFYLKLLETQMFCDFITKKLIPKNKKENLEILFFDENIIQKKNKKNKKSKQKNKIILLNSKEYEYSNKYEIPKAKPLSKYEKKLFVDETERNKLILYGEKIIEEKNENSGNKDYLFNYIIFPILNKNFYETETLDEYYISPDIYSNIDRINSDILSQIMNNSTKKNNNKINQEMENYIYLVYVELWAFCYWYLDSSEKDNAFIQLIKILDKISRFEIEIFQHLFEALEKLKENDKIMTLYEKLLQYKMTPNSYIFSLVNKILKMKKVRKSKDISSNSLFSNSDSHLKRTFQSHNDINILGDKVVFYKKQTCQECFKEIDILELSLNYKNMKKNIFWTECPLCKKEIIPKLLVSLGSELIRKKNEDYRTSIISEFTLLSTYEIKNNLKDIFYRSESKMLLVPNFKENYNNLFWSCIWYFKINKIDFNLFLPYEWSTNQERKLKNSLPNNLISLTKEKIDIKNQKVLLKKYLKKHKNIKKFSKNNYIVHNVHSFNLNQKKLNKIKNNINEKDVKPRMNRLEIESKKRNTLDLGRIRLDTFSEKIISELQKQDKKNLKKSSDKVLKKKLSFNFEEIIEKNELEELDEIYSNKNRINFFNYEDINNKIISPKIRSSYQNPDYKNKFNKENEFNINEIKNKRNKSEERQKFDLDIYFEEN